MPKAKSYRDSSLSAIITVAWFVVVFRIFNSASGTNDNAVPQFILTWIATVSVGILGGIGMHFISMVKKKGWQDTFVYNFFATLNIIVGVFGMMLGRIDGEPTPYLIAASLTVGLIMNRNIYRRRSWISRN